MALLTQDPPRQRPVLAAQGDEMSLQYERERTEGVRCATMRCIFNERGFEQSCCRKGDDGECAAAFCHLYVPMTAATPPRKGAGERTK